MRLPLTQPTGKIRAKQRNSFYEYGIPVAARQSPLQQSMYVEWQIGYDLLASGKDGEKNKEKTSIPTTFKNYKQENKYAYELNEILYYAVKELKFISPNEVEQTYKSIKNTSDANLLDVIDSMRISRTNPIETQINGMNFYEMKVSYPLIMYKFGKYDIYAEVINREKQRAVGVQPMLYLCIPITLLNFSQNPLGRILDRNECGEWIIQKGEAELALELFRIFGMLSKKHRYDVLAILEMLFPQWKE